MLSLNHTKSYIIPLLILSLCQLSQTYHSPTTLDRLSPHSLNRYCKKVHSQSGEDGVIEEIFKRLNIQEGFFVEFGAHNGMTLSNSRHLWEKGWSGAMIEADSALFAQLQNRYRNQPRMICIHAFVSFGGNVSKNEKTFDEIAHQFFPDKEIDFLSIDIDGPDYLILESLKCHPKVICIEGILAWHPLLNIRIPDSFAIKNLHQPIMVLSAIAQQKDYTIICAEGGNAFLVRNDLMQFFEHAPKDCLTIWRDCWRSLPKENRRYIINWRQKNRVIHAFEKDLNEQMPITIDF